jgi:hypothetical protein
VTARTRLYLSIATALVRRREDLGGQLPEDQERTCVERLDECWRAMSVEEQQAVERIAAEGALGGATRSEPAWSESRWTDRDDPSDVRFRIVEIRLPHGPPSRPTFGPFEYAGTGVRERVRRFCAIFLLAYGDITRREARRIVGRSRALDATGRAS